MVELDYMVFRDLLTRRKIATGKSYQQLQQEIGVSPESWHSSETLRLPFPERLPAIARAYEISLEELTTVYEQAKLARKKEKEGRKRAQPRRNVGPEAEVYGVICRKNTLARTNSQVSNGRLGRT